MKSLWHKLHLLRLCKEKHFPLTLQINLWLPIVFFFFSLCSRSAEKKNVKINKQETLPATLPFIPTHGMVVFLLHLNFAHTGYADLSSATKRVEWPRVFTMLTSMPTMSCACCTSKGGSTSQRQRYTESEELEQGLMTGRCCLHRTSHWSSQASHGHVTWGVGTQW